eukprot:90074-Rhodomonas_salina.2
MGDSCLLAVRLQVLFEVSFAISLLVFLVVWVVLIPSLEYKAASGTDFEVMAVSSTRSQPHHPALLDLSSFLAFLFWPALWSSLHSTRTGVGSQTSTRARVGSHGRL